MSYKMNTKQEKKEQTPTQSQQIEAESMEKTKAKLRKYMTDIGVDILRPMDIPEGEF